MTVMKETTTSWKEVVYHAGEPPLGLTAMQDLRDHKFAAVVMKGILAPRMLTAFQQAIEQHRDHAIVTRYINGTLTTIGPYLAKHLKSTDTYFAEAQATNILFPNPKLDLRAHIREQLRYIFGLPSFETAKEPDGTPYAPAIIRLHSNGVNNPLHNDNIMRDAASTTLIVRGLRSQFSCVVCAQECDDGGHLRLYRKPWQPEDERYKVKDGLGYDQGVVEGRDCFVFKPQTGDVYVFNPTNYHEIDAVSGQERRTMGFFFGFFEDTMEQGITWS
jgi:hypothetical protein